MHYYKFNIGDYKSHTSHLDPLEDIAYRRMLDYCYLKEIGLPESLEEIGRLISMRTHCDCIANVLREFFYLDDGVYKNKRVEIDLHEFKSKSEKAANSAKEKWRKHRLSSDANAERTQCENDANAMLTINHKPLTINQEPDIYTQDAKALAIKPKKEKVKVEYTLQEIISLGVDEQKAKDWIAIRKHKKQLVTQSALEYMNTEAKAIGLTLQQAIELCAQKGWGGLQRSYIKKTDTEFVTFYELATGKKPEWDWS